jgi:two-component system chemotaxis response regulator CheB
MNAAGAALSRVRVLIADDSAVMRTALSRAVDSAGTMMVCGTARNGLEALDKIRQMRPDVVTLDVEMPALNGLEVLRQIMKEFPRPVIMVSSRTQRGAETTLEALDIGAFDYLAKDEGGPVTDPDRVLRELVEKIEAAARSPLGRTHSLPAAALQPPVLLRSPLEGIHSTPEIFVIGTSTGGPKALQEILPHLPGDFPVGIIVVQHMPAGFTAPLAKRLDSLCQLRVVEGTDGATLGPGMIFIAPAGKHLTVSRESLRHSIITLSDDPPGTLHKPSVDVTMLSVAKAFGRHAAGVILTGMGTDGMLGMTTIRKAGGITIGQDEATSAVYGMPRCCAESGVLQSIVPLGEVAGELLLAAKYRAREKG